MAVEKAPKSGEGYRGLGQSNQELSPDVVGYFVTSLTDPKPGRAYQMRLASNKEALLNALKKVNGKPVRITGKLRVIDTNGNAKYLVVESVTEGGATPSVGERRDAGGI